MKLTTSATFSILFLLTSQSLASPIAQISDSGAATTSLPAAVNDDADVAAQEISTTRPARQEEAVDEDEDEEVTEVPLVASTAAPVPRPQYNESNVQSELNFISQFNLGPNGSDSTAPAVHPPVPPAVGASLPTPSSTPAPPTPLQSSPNATAPPAAAVEAAPASAVEAAPAPVTNEGDEDEDEADEDSEQTEAPQLLRQPQESGAAAVRPNVPVAAAAAAPQPPKPAVASQAVPQPQVAPSAAQSSPQKVSTGISPQVAAQTAEVDADNENEGDADNDTENEITQDETVKTAEESQVATTAIPATFESEYNYTIQYINDNQEARKNV